MRIRYFSKLIEIEYLKPHVLNDSEVVIDGHIFFYFLYKDAGLQTKFGCESDKYANYLRSCLRKFKKANVKCHFIFKGGTEDFSRRLKWTMQKSTTYSEQVLLIFKRDIDKQILDEMGFAYTISEFEAQKECIAFAQKHQCPLISFSVEYCFAGVSYIPHTTLQFDEQTNVLNCKLFELDEFLDKTQLTEEKLAIFPTLTDENHFEQGYFDNLFKQMYYLYPLKNTRTLNMYERNVCILRWLRVSTKNNAEKKIKRYISDPEKRKRFKELKNKMREIIRRKETPGLPSEYVVNGNVIEISENDPLWFEKGVVCGHIAIPLVNLYHYHVIVGSDATAPDDAIDPMLLSIEIIKYMYNLLTNFENQEITFMSNKRVIPVVLTDSVQKPEYKAICSPFENGWNRLKSGLFFKHFLTESLHGFDFARLEDLPVDSRLLMIALIYFSKKKPEDTDCEGYSVLLSYVALSVVFNSVESSDRNNNLNIGTSKKPVPDPITEKEGIHEEDVLIARALLVEYFRTIDETEANNIFDRNLLQPIEEFCNCLQNLNYLNRLCGSPYKPTNYSKTFNGTFVYLMVRIMKTEFDGNGLSFLIQKLNAAPSVLAFLLGLIETLMLK